MCQCFLKCYFFCLFILEAWKCVRASPQEGSTNGFFLASFVLKESLKKHETDKKIRKINLNEDGCISRKEDWTSVIKNGTEFLRKSEKTNDTNSKSAKRKRLNLSNNTETNCSLQENRKLKHSRTKVKNHPDILFNKKETRTMNVRNMKWWYVLRTDLRKCSSQQFDKQREKILKRSLKRKRLEASMNKECW